MFCRRFDVNRFCVWLYQRFNVVCGTIGACELDSVLVGNVVKKPYGAAVQVRVGDDVVAGQKDFHNKAYGGHSG